MKEADGREFEESLVEDRTRWKEGVRAIAKGMRCIWLPLMTRKETDCNWMDDE